MRILLVLLFIVMPRPTESQKDVPEYDFWDDSVFDNILKDSYASHERDILSNATADDCVNACLQNDSCVSLFYHPGRMECEKLPTHLILNDVRDDDTIRPSFDRRYFRYLPPGSEFCPMEKCFYYDRKARACWKLLLFKGPRYGGRYSYSDAQRACEREGAKIVSLDTLDKVQQLSHILINIPVLTPKSSCRWIHIGGRRTGEESSPSSPYLWKNGEQVSQDPEMWSEPYSKLSKSSTANCLVLAGYKLSGVKGCISFRLGASSCTSLRPAAVCEIPVPADFTDPNAQQTSTGGK